MKSDSGSEVFSTDNDASERLMRQILLRPIPSHADLSGMQTVEVNVRIRWVAIAVLLPIAVVAVYSVCHVAGAVDNVLGMARRISYGALFAFGFWTASAALRGWMSHPVRPATPPASRTPAPPLPSMNPTYLPHGTGSYRVHGTDRDTNFQTSEVVYADSPDNARLKVELKGVEVEAVEAV